MRFWKSSFYGQVEILHPSCRIIQIYIDRNLVEAVRTFFRRIVVASRRERGSVAGERICTDLSQAKQYCVLYLALCECQVLFIGLVSRNNTM